MGPYGGESTTVVRELAAERNRQGLSQEKEAAASGTKQPNVARLELGAVDLSHTTLVRYAAFLGRRIALGPIESAAANEKIQGAGVVRP